MSPTEEFEIVVIGGGGTGYGAASTAAKLGRRVAMVEGAKLGGTCLNVGCVPTKTLVRSAQVLGTVRRAGEFGVRTGDVELDFGAVMARMRATIENFSGEGPLESLRSQGIELLRGHASFEDPRTLRVGRDIYRAEKFVVATGSAPMVPDLPGLPEIEYVTSDGLLELQQLPESILFVGGGIISCEFASIFGAFGSRVSIVSSRLLSNEDPDVGDELARAFEARGIEVLTGGRADGFRREGGRKLTAIRYEDGRTEEREAEVVVLAVGRRPSHDGLNLERAGVETGEKGEVLVGKDMRTNAPHIWAAGDVTGMHMYTHSGDYMGEVAGWNASGGEPRREAQLAVVPRPVYSTPEVAAIGLTEREAERLGCDVEVARVSFADITRAVINGETEGWCKLLAERSSGRILGACIVGSDASEHIGEVAVAMAGGVSAWVLGDTLHPFPTVSEIVRWTADQIGRDAAGGEKADMRHMLYAESLAELAVYRGKSSNGQPITDEQVTEATEPRAGYGEEEDCVAPTPAA